MTKAVAREIRYVVSSPIVWITVLSLLLPIALWGQAAQGGSLGDIARQMRASKDGQSQADASRAQQVADELSEDQNDSAAPAGFKTYKAADYKLWMPTPYAAAGHDDAGMVLSVALADEKQLMVLLGSAIPVQGQSDSALEEAATHFARNYSQSSKCTKASSGNHSSYQCALTAAHLLGQRVTGTAWFVVGASSLYPVVCVAADHARSVGTTAQKASDPHASENDDFSAEAHQKCDVILQSIQLNQNVATEPALSAGKRTDASPQPAATRQETSQSAAPQPETNATINLASGSTIPAGSKVARFQYCSRPLQCWDASVLVPADAQLLTASCKQYVYSSKIQGTEFLLMAGPADGQCNGASASSTDLVRWRQLVDPESKRAPGTYSTISSQTTTLDSKPGIITTLSFRKGLDDWMGKRIEIESNGVPLVVGCMAPRDHFADGDTVCTALIGSLQLP
jgi:hypothetical protein